ncbi:MAG: GTPase HflX [Planctomycetota bacterium]|jgi:GTP-binding protein HflX
MSKIHREKLKVLQEEAVLVHVQLPGEYVDEGDPFRELRALTETAGARVVGELTQKRSKPRGGTYLGRGKVEELAGLVQLTEATLVIFDNDLSPAQIRNLERAVECKIIDRSELILDIFANRATTHAAKLQVEIAQLEYTYPRLRAMWDHLGQIVGGAPVGIGTRGPGEQQLEIDRRLVQQRLRQLRREQHRIEGRKAREVEQRNVDHFTTGLVGYTNAGKSTLFNRLTAGGAFEHEKLFATLATRVERWDVGGGNQVLLSDTVGFIRDLPHHLVASFRSTLAETVAADLLIIVLDVADREAPMQLETVERTLDEVGASGQPRLLVLNKVDRVEDPDELLVWLNRRPEAMPISAASGQGLDELREVVLGHLIGPVRAVCITLPLREARAIDFLENRAEVLDRHYHNQSVDLSVRIGRRQVEQLLARGTAMTIDGQSPLEALRAAWPDETPVAAAPLSPPHVRYFEPP